MTFWVQNSCLHGLGLGAAGSVGLRRERATFGLQRADNLNWGDEANSHENTWKSFEGIHEACFQLSATNGWGFVGPAELRRLMEEISSKQGNGPGFLLVFFFFFYLFGSQFIGLSFSYFDRTNFKWFIKKLKFSEYIQRVWVRKHLMFVVLQLYKGIG